MLLVVVWLVGVLVTLLLLVYCWYMVAGDRLCCLFCMSSVGLFNSVV